jgi:hypothetical protein
MPILNPVVDTSPHLLVIATTQVLQGCTVETKAIRHNAPGLAMSFHQFLEWFQRRL